MLQLRFLLLLALLAVVALAAEDFYKVCLSFRNLSLYIVDVDIYIASWDK
jgi:hypothetical protein